MEDCISEREYIQILMVGNWYADLWVIGNRIYITAIIKAFYHIRQASLSFSLWCKAEDTCALGRHQGSTRCLNRGSGVPVAYGDI